MSFTADSKKVDLSGIQDKIYATAGRVDISEGFGSFGFKKVNICMWTRDGKLEVIYIMTVVKSELEWFWLRLVI